MRKSKTSPFWALAVVAALGMGLTACGGGGSDTAMPEPPPPPPPPPPHVCEAGPSQDCVDARQMELAALGADATKAQHDAAEMALAAAQAALAEQMAMEARAALVAGAECTAATAECVAAHDALIAALQADVNRLADDDSATNAQQAAAQMALNEAKEARNAVSMALAELDRSTETGREVGEAMDAANGLADDRSPEAIAAAKVAIEEAEQAVGDSDAYEERIAMAKTAVARAEELNAIDAAIMAADEAADGLVENSDADAVAAAQKLIDDAQALIDGNEHLTEAEETSYTEDIADLQRPVTVAKNRNDDAANAAEEEKRMAAEEEERKKNEAMAATAAKLYAGLEHGLGNTENVRTGAYNTDEDGVEVTIGTAAAVELSEDKKTSISVLHGWGGKRYTAEPDNDGTYEAVVYSNVGDPTEGDPFNEEYTLNDTTGETVDVTTLAGYVTGRVASPRFDQSAGTKEFKLGTNLQRVVIAGSYHGVSGTYYCAPATGETCSSTVAESGFTLAGGTWTFKPGTATAKVMSVADTAYASYGWWLHMAENGTLTASAFVDEKGTVADATGITALRGTATYMGGAAGKYALSSSTGGTNDAGHFTARATLEADFNADMVSGTIDTFVDGDGASKNWSVELKKTVVGDTGAITAATTVWTIGEDAAAASGTWSGSLKDTGDDGVPNVGTGTFHSTYGQDGRMVGAFGANKQ